MKFTKMQALGNDYVYINCIDQQLDNLSDWAIRLSNRHYGVGSDGMILICPSGQADFRMRVFNPDGTEAEMCGNALRSVGKYVYDYGLTQQTAVTVETLGGIKHLQLSVTDGKVSMITADLGPPILEPKLIPVDYDEEFCIDHPLEVAGSIFRVSPVSMGNPHAVTFIDDVDGLDLDKFGPAMECHPFYPRRVNAEFAQVVDRRHLKMRVWERGTGETLACGTGCCVSVVGGVLTGRCERQVTVQQIGGELYVEWNASNGHLFLTGPSTRVFDGEI